jgi:hypothetical protein
MHMAAQAEPNPGHGGSAGHDVSRDGDVASVLDPRTRAFYLHALDTLDRGGIRYAVAGAYALAYYAGIVRHTKDLDLFMRRQDVPRALNALEAIGCRPEWTHPHWLAKAHSPDGDAFLDLIFRSANGQCAVDDGWLDHAVEGTVIGRPAMLCPAEEIIWSKSFVLARERFDGADIAHLIAARGRELDWDRLLRRFEGHEAVLLGHLFFFGYVFPAERSNVPQWVTDDLIAKARAAPAPAEKLCRGTMLSWDQYLVDVRDRGYADARLKPHGTLTPEEVERWTNAVK